MVRVPKVPLSITAVDSKTPSSISVADILVSGLFGSRVVLFRTPFFARHARVPGKCRRPSIEAVGAAPYAGLRQPLPKTAHSKTGPAGDALERCPRICANRTDVRART